MSRIYIDDQDLSKVVYNGTWMRGGSANEYAGTVASSTTVGDSFTVSFKGDSITVYGTIDSTSGGVVTTYSIDEAPPAQVTSPSGTGDTFRQQFWKSESLSLAQHKLVVTMSKVIPDPDLREGTVWFDYFLAIDPTITSLPSPTPTAHSTSSDQHASPPVGAIVGGVIGGLFFVLAAAIFFVFCCCRKRSPSQEFLKKSGGVTSRFNFGNQASVEPFIFGLRDAPPNNSLATRNGEFDPGLLMASTQPSRKSIVTFNPPTAAPISPPGLLGMRNTGDLGIRFHFETPPQESSPVPSQASRTSGAGPNKRPGSGGQDSEHQSQSSHSNLEPTRRHIDSGLRVENMQTPTLGIPGGAVELPPIYSPV